MKIYIKAKSKAQINRDLLEGKKFTGENYSIFGGGGFYNLDKTLPIGTVIAVYDKMQSGSPVAKSWGTWDGEKLK